ncbi:MAG: menaquinone biosynthesis protein [Armatimonadetes bacterium]|nr:menaquinone biosynthesis protein [Armatimonadota bacterium]
MKSKQWDSGSEIREQNSVAHVSGPIVVDENGSAEDGPLRREIVRLGCLPYLNVKPLVYPFEHGRLPEGWDLVYATPAILARMLSEGRVDAAPVSSFACLANPHLSIVPDVCIASEGPVQSVLMLSKVEIRQIRTVAIDTSSLTGRALLAVVLSESYGIEPLFVACAPDLDKMLAESDAALIIGNPAMLADRSGLHVLDLGEEWLKLTGLPAVFAVWAGPAESITRQLIQTLLVARVDGMERAGQIAAEESPRLGLQIEMCEDYLTRVIRYELGHREIESLRVFGQKALQHGLIDVEPEIRLAAPISECRVGV